MDTISREHDDNLLLKGILEADPVQLKKLYSAYLPGIIGFIKNNNGTEEEARDVFQDAVMVIYKKVQAGDLKLNVSLQSFLFAICRNMWLSQLRSKKRIVAYSPGDNTDDIDMDTLQKMEIAQRERLFYKHFNSLGEKCKEILRLFFSKTPLKEIAVQFKTSESYIKKRKFKCKEQLVESIKKDDQFKEMI